MSEKKFCKDCAWLVDGAKCHAPQNMKISLVDGKGTAGASGLTYAEVLRENECVPGGYLCGAEARWFVQAPPAQPLTPNDIFDGRGVARRPWWRFWR